MREDTGNDSNQLLEHANHQRRVEAAMERAPGVGIIVGIGLALWSLYRGNSLGSYFLIPRPKSIAHYLERSCPGPMGTGSVGKVGKNVRMRADYQAPINTTVETGGYETPGDKKHSLN